MDLFSLITPQTTLLTPNRRLSASILKQYAQWQLNQAKTCWQTLDILPLYPTWLERLWVNFITQEMKQVPSLLTTQQEQILWEKILRDTPQYDYLLQLSDTAKLAKSAWETLKRWRVSLNDPHLNLTEDSQAFLNWAQQFQHLCEANHWIDHSSLTDVLIDKIKTQQIIPPKHLILIGFTEIAPQYLHLFHIIEQCGSQITYYETPSRNQSTQSIALMDTETEIQIMAQHAKSLLRTSNSIGCVIPKLETQREQVHAIFSNVLGENQFNISAGKNLISYPIIHAALELLQLNTTSLPINTLSRILRTPFMGEAEREQYRRAQFDNYLRSANITTVSLLQLVSSEKKQNLTATCPALAKRIKHFLEKRQETKKTRPISQWIPLFIELLTILGWPGERSLNSHEYQVVQNSWLPLLNEYATFDTILTPQTYPTALHYLTCLATSTIFQPESPEAPIQVLGLLEAAEIPFEHLWVIGLDDATWPSRPKPNPFIPLRLQKTLNMPNASADRELLYCQQLTKQLQFSAKHLIISYPLKQDDTELRPSALLKNFTPLPFNQLTLDDYISPADTLFHTQLLENIQDEMAPPISPREEIRGGASIFKKQAECPFKAFTELRLHARKIEETTIGLRPQDRGSMVHKALELIWRELHDLSNLLMQSDEQLYDIIQRHAKTAFTEIIHFMDKANSRYFTLELQRLEKLLWDWLHIEKLRPPFRVIAEEKEVTATIGHITASLRIDRIDELPDGSQLIIDYKTGNHNEAKKWFGERPDEPQLPLYCLIQPEMTAGIAFAQIHPSHMEIIGASQTNLNIKSIKILPEIKHADAAVWNEQTHHWRHHLTNLGNAFYEGHAAVHPKDINLTCRQCNLQSICRIHTRNTEDNTEDATDDNGNNYE